MTGHTVDSARSSVFSLPNRKWALGVFKVPLYDGGIELESQTSQGKTKTVNLRFRSVIQNMSKEIDHEHPESRSSVRSVLTVVYYCESGCKPSRGQRRHNDSSERACP